MNKIKKLTLIEGKFSDEDAKEILINIFSNKINFHQMKNFSSQERLGKDDAIAKKKIPALKKELVKLDKILSEAKTKNKKLMITSDVNIYLSDD